MRWLITACLALLVMSPACFDGDDDDGGPLDPEPPVSPYSGTFYVKTVVTETSCHVALPIDALTPVAVEGDSITVGSMRGTWDGAAKRGTGSSVSPLCVPAGDCVACTMLAFDIVFVSVDSFAGTYYSTFTYTGCEAESCHTRYAVTGAR